MKFLKILSLAGLVFLLTQCYPEGPTTYDEMDIVYSNYYQGYNFASKKTYSIPDKIVKVDENLVNGGSPSYVKATYADPILAKIKQEMKDYGWTEVTVSDSPDVVLSPAAMEYTSTYYYYDYWYGGYYGWYYPYPVTASYTTGSLVVAMIDPNLLTANDKQTVVWTFIVNGLLEGSTSEFTNRFTKAINQAFIQSEYLKIK